MESVVLKYLDSDTNQSTYTADPSQTGDGGNSSELQNKYHCLEYLPEFLIKTYIKLENEEESFAVKDIIKDLFKKI